jgi:uncharacterized protein
VDADGWTGLMHCALQGHIPVAEYLLSQGVGVEGRGNDGRTALMVAAGAGRVDMLTFLVERGRAEVEARDGAGMTALLAAAEAGRAEAVECLIKRHRSRVDAKDDQGRTALHLATAMGHNDVITMLVGTPGNPFVRDTGMF